MSDQTQEPTPLEELDKAQLLEIAADMGLEFTTRHAEKTIIDGIRAARPTDRAGNPQPDEDDVADPVDPAAVTVNELGLSAKDSIPYAGLLAARPELAAARLTPAEWDKQLDEYLKSPRP